MERLRSFPRVPELTTEPGPLFWHLSCLCSVNTHSINCSNLAVFQSGKALCPRPILLRLPAWGRGSRGLWGKRGWRAQEAALWFVYRTA